MLFHSAVFILAFLPTTILGYFLLNRWRPGSASQLWLVAASLFFYGWWAPEYLPVILLSILVNFLAGRKLCALHAEQEGRGRPLLALGIAFNLGMLGYFKYTGFLTENLNTVGGFDIDVVHVALPLAISFFTFQQIAYLVDCQRGLAREYGFARYSLFVTFFPQLIAGPIVHHREMMPQFESRENRRLNWNHLSMGIFVFTIGLFKKIIIADGFAVTADHGFANHGQLGFLDAWLTTFSYTFQIYFDFSGYCDMATGAALMLNIRLPVNFNSPYRARSIQEFWRRWHMTLSRWLRDYLYIPLGGSRHGNLRTFINLNLTFLLGGLWHGAGWTFLLWGAMHGGALVVHRLWQRHGTPLPAFWAWMCTFLFVHWAWVMFRASSVEQALHIWKVMLGWHVVDLPDRMPMLFPWGVDALTLLLAIGGFTIFCARAANALQLVGMVPYGGRLAFRQQRWLGVANGVLSAFCIQYVITTRSEVFLYFNF